MGVETPILNPTYPWNMPAVNPTSSRGGHGSPPEVDCLRSRSHWAVNPTSGRPWNIQRAQAPPLRVAGKTWTRSGLSFAHSQETMLNQNPLNRQLDKYELSLDN